MEIKLQGIKNIRDFSEYGFSGYIRSAHLRDMTERDAQVLLEQYNLKTVIDLRTTVEKNERPDYVMEGVHYIHIPLFDESKIGISHEKSVRGMGMGIPDMPRLYRDIVTDEISVSRIKEVMRVIDDVSRDGSVLWHCTEGKDRCGIISALFLLSRGINKDAVMQDYLRTNETAGDRAKRVYDIALERSGNQEMAEKVREVFLAKREYLEPIMDRLMSLAGVHG